MIKYLLPLIFLSDNKSKFKKNALRYALNSILISSSTTYLDQEKLDIILLPQLAIANMATNTWTFMPAVSQKPNHCRSTTEKDIEDFNIGFHLTAASSVKQNVLQLYQHIKHWEEFIFKIHNKLRVQIIYRFKNR